jgi:hypothetical protein
MRDAESKRVDSKHLKALVHALNTTDPGALLSEWTHLFQANMRRILDVTRRCFEMVPQTQAEIARLAGEPFASADKDTQQCLAPYAKAISDNSDAAAATVKDFLAKTISFTGLVNAGEVQARSRVWTVICASTSSLSEGAPPE